MERDKDIYDVEFVFECGFLIFFIVIVKKGNICFFKLFGFLVFLDILKNEVILKFGLSI